MVGKDKNLVFAAFYVVLSGLESFNNSWKYYCEFCIKTQIDKYKFVPKL